MSISPQNGGFHRSTGGGPLRFSPVTAAAMPSSLRPLPCLRHCFPTLFRPPLACSQLCDSTVQAAEDSVSLATECGRFALIGAQNSRLVRLLHSSQLV